MRGGRGIRGRRRATLTLTLRNKKEQLIDLFGLRQVTTVVTYIYICGWA
jgi:hypothetical protein